MGGGKTCRRKSITNTFVGRTIPVLLVGILIVYAVSILLIYIQLAKMIDQSGNHLISQKEQELERKIKFYTILKHDQWQLVDNYVFVFYNMYNAYLNNLVVRSANYTHMNNYLYFEGKNTSYNESFWYIRSNKTDYDTDLNYTNQENVKNGDVLLPLWKSFLDGEIYPDGIIMNSYISYENDGMKLTYPAEFKDFYKDWDKKEILGPSYFPDSINMTDYDPRGRDFYIYSKPNTPNTTFYGPYFNPGNQSFYAATPSKSVMDSSDNLNSMISIDINLNYKDNFSELVGFTRDYAYIFITSLKAEPLFHSMINITQSKDPISLARLEFSKTNQPLDKEPTSKEANYFNTEIVPSIINTTEFKALHYNRFGSKQRLSALPIEISTLWPETGEVHKKIRAITGMVIDDQDYIKDISNTSDVLLGIFFLLGFFLFIIFILMLLVWGGFYKITSYSLRPIRVLNRKIKALLKNNAELNLLMSQASSTSKDAKELYETFSELMITRRFAKNNIVKNDALAIMDYADVFMVMRKNEQAKGICLTNIANIHFINKDFAKASQSYKDASGGAQSGCKVAKQSNQIDEYNKYFYFFGKRRYYMALCTFMKTKQLGTLATEDQWLIAEKVVNNCKKLISENMKSIDDLMITLHLSSSYGGMMNRKLISADNDLNMATMTFKFRRRIDQTKRPDIPIIPDSILQQRIVFQKGMLKKAYGK